jgi:hypothetical protein
MGRLWSIGPRTIVGLVNRSDPSVLAFLRRIVAGVWMRFQPQAFVVLLSSFVFVKRYCD